MVSEQLKNLENKFLKVARERIDNPQMAELIPNHLKLQSINGKIINVLATDAIVYLLCTSQYKHLLSQVIKDASETDYDIRFYDELSKIEDVEKIEVSNTMKVLMDHSDVNETFIDSTQTFENFVVSKSNKYAWEFANTVSKEHNLGKRFNPLFISGRSGIGKTHLINAVGNFVLQEYGGTKKVRYYSASELKSLIMDLFSSVKKKSGNAVEEWKQRLVNSCDLLIIDDIQLLTNMPSILTVFFDIFNSMMSRKKQVIFTSDIPVSEMRATKMFHERILTRFNAGAVASIEAPDIDLKKKIIENIWKEQERTGTVLSDEAVTVIANNTADIRSLNGAISSLVMHLTFNPHVEYITKEIVQQEIGEDTWITEPEKKETSLYMIAKIIADKYGYRPEDLKSKSKIRQLANVRKIFMYVAVEVTTLSRSEIGRHINRTHSTIINTHKEITKKLESDKMFQSEINSLLEEIKS